MHGTEITSQRRFDTIMTLLLRHVFVGMVHWTTTSQNQLKYSYLIPREIVELLYFAQAHYKFNLEIPFSSRECPQLAPFVWRYEWTEYVLQLETPKWVI